MNFDLNSMSKDELVALRSDVDKALKSIDGRRKADALKAAQEAAKEHGFTLAELTDGAKPTKKVAAKFVNPDNAAQTWSGRGRQPIWFRDALANGASEDDLAI
ncbi:MAG: H-NS histone family protein [Paracoccaceae bacterium]|nr:H-NS histone family protein [Paracoccaceae bacterium]MDG2260372.1 H-NS histone family protein [Paracoccaceae bacterium]